MVDSSSMRCNAWVVVATALWIGSLGIVLSPSLAYAAERMAPNADGVDYDGLMAAADSERTRGEHAAAARSYTAAYQALPEADQPGLMGELAIDNALVEYGEAHEEQPEELALLEEPLALLDAFIETRARAHAAGLAEAVPPRLEQERERLRAMLEEARIASMPEPEEPVDEVSPISPVIEDEPTQDRPGNRKADVTIVASGVALLVGGAALVGSGIWNFATVNRQVQSRRTALDAGLFTDEAQDEFLADLSQWENRWRGTATGLVVAGSILAATGVGLTTWGAVRMRRNGRASKRQASVGVPLVSRGRVGVVLTVDF